ncbi:hypothetical protein [Rhodococcus sp. 077-4]|uniref:hypothetical protein n=1 Tax=Rhodococcus sp. 077-4 TaxID=2789271 RepID=UPI0039F4852D
MTLAQRARVTALVLLLAGSAACSTDGTARPENDTAANADIDTMTDWFPAASEYEAGTLFRSVDRSEFAAVLDEVPIVTPPECGDLVRTNSAALAEFIRAAPKVTAQFARTSDSHMGASIFVADQELDLDGDRTFVERCPKTDISKSGDDTGTQSIDVSDLPRELRERYGVTDTLFTKNAYTNTKDGDTASSTVFTSTVVVRGYTVYLNVEYATGVSVDGDFTPLRDADKDEVIALTKSMVDKISPK